MLIDAGGSGQRQMDSEERIHAEEKSKISQDTALHLYILRSFGTPYLRSSIIKWMQEAASKISAPLR